MSIDTLLVILLVWTVAGTLAAFAFGKAMRVIGTAPYQEELLPTTADNVRYFRRNRRKAGAKRVTVARMHNGTMKQAVG
jgi:hypothetical protein